MKGELILFQYTHALLFQVNELWPMVLPFPVYDIRSHSEPCACLDGRFAEFDSPGSFGDRKSFSSPIKAVVVALDGFSL